MLKTNTLFYFTDGSIVINEDGIPFGSSSFVKMKRNCKILDKAVFYSYPDIHYLESLAIYNALGDIDMNVMPGTRCEIITDSDNSYYLLRKLMEDPSYKNYVPTTQFEFQTYNTLKLLEHVLSKNIDVRIYCCKSHATPEMQLEYFREQGFKINLNDARFLCSGNHIVDRLSNWVSKDPVLFNKYIPSIVPSNWAIVV